MNLSARHVRPSLLSFALLVALPGLLAGCGDDDDADPGPKAGGSGAGGMGGAAGKGGGGGAGGSGGAGASGAGGAGAGGASGASGAAGAGGAPLPLPTLSELPTGKFNFLPTGGPTTCSKGSDYGFYVRPGATGRVVVNFSGGGACWDDATCAAGIFSESVQGTPPPAGLFDHANAANPVADWTHVFVPYCTADVHWGDNVQAYAGGANPIRHKGAVNARAVLDWVYREFAAPERVFVTGCSAGAYGSALWSAHVREHYKDAPTAVAQLGDAGAGISPGGFFQTAAAAWKPQSAYPTWIGDFSQYTELTPMYVAIADHYPGSLFSQLTSRLDQTQVSFYSLMGGPGGANAWSQAMLASLAAIDADTANFSSYVWEGSTHCAIEKNAFYTVSENGTSLASWVASLTTGTLPPNVACPGCTLTPPAAP
ncbi:MAG TPA: pectin acetylesterase-family hydrolase [Polyangiaceae bacterium]|nr:pectin acetylesterase-family hydrolase [Polyangiaceae bacterium]